MVLNPVNRRVLRLPLALAICLSCQASLARETGGSSGSGSGASEDAAKYVKTLAECKDITIGSAPDGVKIDQEERRKKIAEAFKKVFEDAADQFDPKLEKNEIKHLFVQMISETGLVNLTEGKPNPATTDENYKGRGFIQVTHKEGYELCVKFTNESKSDRKADAAKISQGGDAADKLMGNQAKDDLYFAAMCTMAWWQNAKKESKNDPKFEDAIKQGKEGVKRVSEVANAGPASKSGVKLTDGKEERANKAWEEVDKCLP